MYYGTWANVQNLAIETLRFLKYVDGRNTHMRILKEIPIFLMHRFTFDFSHTATIVIMKFNKTRKCYGPN